MKILMPLSVLVLTGCQTLPPTVFVREVPVSVSSTNHLDVIRFPSTYKAYTVGRRPDPSNPTMMHEAHILYVRESPDYWNLHPASATPPANVAGTRPADGAFVPLPLNEQLRQEVQKQQQVSQSLAEQARRVQQTTDVLVPAARKAVELTTQIQQRQISLEERLRRLEEAQRPSSFSDWPGVGSTNR